MRILHISDIHIFCPGAITLPKVINKRFLGLVNWYLKRHHTVNYRLLDLLLSTIPTLSPDVICVTGDLAHLGQEEEFKIVARWLSELERFAPVKLVPGNHDLYVHEAALYLQRYLKVFFSISQRTSFHEEDLSDLFPQVDVFEDAALIGLSSAYVCGWALATGRLGQRQLNALSSALDAVSDKGLARIILIHHPPIAGFVKKRKALLDINDLEQVVASRGAELFLFGHSHRRYNYLQVRPKLKILFLCAPAITSIKKEGSQRAGFYLIDIKKTKVDGSSWNTSVMDFVLADDKKSFVRQKEFNISLGTSSD